MINLNQLSPDLLFGISAFVSGSVLIYLFLRDRVKKKKNPLSSLGNTEGSKDVLVIELEKLNALWQERAKIEVYIDQLARLWRTYEETDSGEPEEGINFRHDLLLEFYVRYLRGRTWFKGRIKSVILEVLKILDEEGDVPSVVRAKRETYDLDENTYTLLSRVSLLKHSINVAEEGMNSGVSGILEPQLVLACLSHDLGKIPKYFSEFYTLGDHPLISVMILENIHGFRELPFAEEVRQAVANHHRAGRGKLLELLKQADRKARRKEITEMLQKKEQAVLEKIKLKETESKSEEIETKEEVKEKIREKNLKKEKEPVRREEEKRVSVSTFYQDTSEESTEEKVVYDYDLSWLKVDEFLQELKKEINQVAGGKWIAFSMPDGVVYVHPAGLWAVLKRLALKEKVPEVVTCEGDRTLKRSILVSLINALRKEGCIADGLIQEGYFAAPFLVYREDEESPTRVLYTPFKAEAFGVLPSELENQKGEILKKITKVEPAYS